MSAVSTLESLEDLSSFDFAESRTPSSYADGDLTPQCILADGEGMMLGAEEMLQEIPELDDESWTSSLRQLTESMESADNDHPTAYEMRRVQKVFDFNDVCNLEALEELSLDTWSGELSPLRRVRKCHNFTELWPVSEDSA